MVSAQRRRQLGTYLLLAVAIALLAIGSARAQLPLPQLRALELVPGASPQVAVGCVRLDGRCIFELAAPTAELRERLTEIEGRLRGVARQYRRGGEATAPIVETRNNSGLTDIHVVVGERDVRLLTVTALDAETQSLQIDRLAGQITQDLRAELVRSRQEREGSYLLRQGRNGAAAIAAAAVATLPILWGRRFLKGLEARLASTRAREPVTSKLERTGNLHLTKLAKRLLRLLQAGVWLGAGYYSLGLFPQTRPLQVLLLFVLRVPLRAGIVAIGTWVAIRLSFAAIDRIVAAVGNNTLLAPEASWRLQLRLTTITGVSKGVASALWCGVGILVALAAIGIDIGPILAGAGIVGIAVSLASQNLIRDAINGFFIILEDQYGIGDAIALDEKTGGLVENMNLRITQLRDIEGRLITVPNSEIRIVANLSSNWSRSDLKIPIAYHADLDRAIAHIQNALQTLWHDAEWSDLILEKPEILGVDEFAERGAIIRILIKTQPLKQWPVARESRRRIKAALDTAGIPLAVAQERVWIDGGPAAAMPLDRRSHRNHSESQPH